MMTTELARRCGLRRYFIDGLLGVWCILLAFGCSRTPAPEQQTELVVFAAASLREVFGAIGVEYTKAHPDTKVSFNFAGTQELRTQIEQGARADVFAGADTKHSTEMVRQGLLKTARIFAENEPILVVSNEMGSSLRSFADLPAARRIVLGVPEVPIGRYASQILDNAANKWGSEFRSRVDAKVVSRELNVRQVLSKVILGEADAGIVYRSDVGKAVRGRVVVVDIPTEFNVVARYPVAVLESSGKPEAAEQLVSFVLSDPGRELLHRAGFQTPTVTSSK